jgi:hypothetical protein
VLNAHAEAERSHPVWIINARHNLGEHMSGPGVIRGQKIREPLDVIPSTAPPRHLTQIKAVVDAVVHERREPVLIDRIPKAQLGGDSIVEPVQKREAVASLRRRCEPQKFGRPDVLEKGAIGRRGGVMEFIDDDDVEVIGSRDAKPAALRLWIEAKTWSNSADVDRPPTALPTHDRVGSDEMSPSSVRGSLHGAPQTASRALKVISKPRVIDRGHDRLPCARCRNKQVAVVPKLTRERDPLEQALLERFGPKFDRTEDDHWSGCRTTGFGGKVTGRETKSPLFQ